MKVARAHGAVPIERFARPAVRMMHGVALRFELKVEC